MRRVLAVIHAPVYGGLHNLAQRLRPDLLARGWEMHVVLPLEAEEAAERLRRADVPVSLLPLHRLRRSRALQVHREYFRTLRYEVGLLVDLVRRTQIDIIQSNGLIHYHGVLAARLAKRPLVLQLNSSLTPRLLREIALPLSLAAKVVMAEGEGVVRAHRGLHLRGDRLVRFFPPVESQIFRPDPDRRTRVREALGIGPTMPVIGTLGNYTWQKGHDLLLAAAEPLLRLYRELHVLILGNVVESNAEWYARSVRRRVETLEPALRQRIHFVQPGENVPDWLPALDVFLLSSRAEGVATATLEAMACGLPVVAFDVGSVREVVRLRNTGLLVSPNKPAEMAEACKLLLADPQLAETLGRRGRALVRNRHSVAECAAAHIAAYERALRP